MAVTLKVPVEPVSVLNSELGLIVRFVQVNVSKFAILAQRVTVFPPLITTFPTLIPEELIRNPVRRPDKIVSEVVVLAPSPIFNILLVHVVPEVRLNALFIPEPNGGSTIVI